MKLKKLTQRALADNFVKQMQAHLDDPEMDREGDPLNGLYKLHRVLAAKLDEAQNTPPYGKADGSIDDEHFKKLREVERAAQNLIWAIDRWEMGRKR